MTKQQFIDLTNEVKNWRYVSPLSECLAFALSQKGWEVEHHGENTVLLKRRDSEQRAIVSAGYPNSDYRYYGYAPETTFRANSLTQVQDWLESL